MRHPGPCVSAWCELVALLLSRNMICARPRFTPHFHLRSSQLFSSHPITASTFLISWKRFLSQFFCTYQRGVFLHKKRCTQKAAAQRKIETQKTFTHGNLLCGEALGARLICKPEAFYTLHLRFWFDVPIMFGFQVWHG